ncbi:Peptidase S1B glutamyl endopeptidase I [Penicillium odoratum]|uniref:Peptidase S1B glutamyl endopeptidase I n=1 Tax=Penicillium odoratum TaxID=1167516 RepID=UPI002546EE9F|nr:Peptidase S1B glutamyl endopeptidase I [Penicillium odoratum]KAJ5777287.1 Peptidase S1B glutamyl endopeptidase I [Penicillium odoratum]
MSLIAGTWDLNVATSEAAESHFKEEQHEESVFEDLDDNRKPVPLDEIQKDTGKYRSIVKLFMRYAGQKADDGRYAMGTGWLVEPDILVTAGHCAFDWSQNNGEGFGRAVEVKAYIGYNGKASVTKEALEKGEVQFRHGVKIVTTQKWLDSGMFRQNDVSFIKLNKPFTGVTRFNFKDTPMQGSEAIGVVGYPGDKDYKGEKGAQMYEEFRDVTWDLKKSSLNMLEYRINSYAGQSGSPVILKGASKGVVQTSIGAHVYGGGSKNCASTIGQLGNPYMKYLSVFTTEDPKEAKSLQPRSGVKYVDMGSLTEDSFGEEEDFWQTMKSVLDVGAPLVGGALKIASPFFGPIGGPLAALAGTALGAAGKKLEAESEFDEPKKQPSKQPSVIHQAIMNEACLQALFHTPVQNGEFRKELNTKVYDEYRKRATAAEVVSPKVLPAIMASVFPISQDIVRQALAGKPEADLGPSEKIKPIKMPKSYESMGDSLAKRILDAPSTQPVEESIWDIFGTVLSAANKTVNVVQQGLDVANKLLPPKTESSFDESTPLDADLTVLGKRAVLSAAVATVLQDAPLDKLQAEGLFTTIKDAAAKYGPTVIKYGPVVIDALRPVVKAIADDQTRGEPVRPPVVKPRTPETGKSPYETMYGTGGPDFLAGECPQW